MYTAAITGNRRGIPGTTTHGLEDRRHFRRNLSKDGRPGRPGTRIQINRLFQSAQERLFHAIPVIVTQTRELVMFQTHFEELTKEGVQFGAQGTHGEIQNGSDFLGGGVVLGAFGHFLAGSAE